MIKIIAHSFLSFCVKVKHTRKVIIRKLKNLKDVSSFVSFPYGNDDTSKTLNLSMRGLKRFFLNHFSINVCGVCTCLDTLVYLPSS